MQDSNDTISQIFDKLFKRMLSLSRRAVIDFINGLFGDNFPLDSEVTFNSTEHVNSKYRRTIADIIITLRHGDKCKRFHMETQISDDYTIVLRVFEYGFHDALKHQKADGNKITLPFPAPMIIFLEHTPSTPDKVVLELDFGEQGKFDYTVSTVKFLTLSLDELTQRRMIILLPLCLLRLRQEINRAKEEGKAREKADELKALINDILKSIADNEEAGNITNKDAVDLLYMVGELYDYLYGGIEEFEKEEVSTMLPGAMVLKCDADRMAANMEAKKQVARKLKSKGFANDDIAELTELSLDEVEDALMLEAVSA